LRLTGWSAQRTLRVLKVSLARPVTWIEQAQRNRDGRLWLELSELDIADWATVVSIDECPSEIEGEGRLVTGRFEHSSAEVLNLYVEGERNPIGTTASHPFWSQDRQAFVSAELLRTTERLRLEDGRTAAVIRIEQLPGTQSVYNLEVDGEHVYHVGLNGVLVHNTCGGTGYRVMSPEEFADAAKGKWADSVLVQGDAVESGNKWLWKNKDEAQGWLDWIRKHGEDGVITEVPTMKPLDSYPNFPHPPEGTAIHVPIPDLGPALPLP
jgi:hypothetical protein